MDDLFDDLIPAQDNLVFDSFFESNNDLPDLDQVLDDLVADLPTDYVENNCPSVLPQVSSLAAEENSYPLPNPNAVQQITTDDSNFNPAEEDLQDLVQSLFGDDPELFSKGGPDDPISMLDEIFDEMSPENNESQIEAETIEQTEPVVAQDSESPVTVNINNNLPASSFKRFDGTAKFKSVPAYKRCLEAVECDLPLSTSNEVGLMESMPTRIPEPSNQQLSLDPPQQAIRVRPPVTYPPSRGYLSRMNATSSSIVVNPPIVQSSQLPTSIEVPTKIYIPSSSVYQHIKETVNNTQATPSSYYNYGPGIKSKLEVLKTKLENGASSCRIQDTYSNQLICKRLKHLKAKSRQTGLLKILPKGGFTNQPQSLLRKNQIFASVSGVSTVYIPSTTNASTAAVNAGSVVARQLYTTPPAQTAPTQFAGTSGGVCIETGAKQIAAATSYSGAAVQSVGYNSDYTNNKRSGNKSTSSSSSSFRPVALPKTLNGQAIESGVIVPYAIYKDPVLFPQAYQEALNKYGQQLTKQKPQSINAHNRSMVDRYPWCNKSYYPKKCRIPERPHICNISCQTIQLE